MSDTVYMMPPPDGEDRWAAGSMAPAQVVIGAVLFAFGSVIYGLRIYTRVGIMNNALRLDDYLTGATLFSCWMFYACTMRMVAQGGCGINFWQVSQAKYQILLKWTIPVNIFYMLSSDLAKISLLFFYLRLCPERVFRRIVQVLAGLFVTYAVVYAMISLFGCQPINASWDLVAMATGKCVDKFGFFLAASVANVVMDLVIFASSSADRHSPSDSSASKAIPVAAVHDSVIIVAIYNCVLTIKLFSSPNYTWGLAYELCWMYAELTGCIICASASSLKPFFKKCIPGIFSSLGASYGGPSHPTTKGSHAIRSRRQLSRRQSDAIELESGDDSESGRKIGDDDEAKLWPRPTAEDGGHTVQVSAPRQPFPTSYNPKVRTHSYSQEDAAKGINIVSTTEIQYSPRQ
ncbi:hypothetical protein CEP52_001115 [Fusarium oligoseptatum]|uniref:Rhodopsin domain-containing protein n=1 Tax=Fusarium oligoseptatum TaxID=2604345 RepID=A0A428UKU4_9HYPO|nr:hypothetical protein CEP52_001115 [Fusarium oligoseptatum]